MRRSLFVVAALALFLGWNAHGYAQTNPVLTLVFSANSWGYLKPCPT